MTKSGKRTRGPRATLDDELVPIAYLCGLGFTPLQIASKFNLPLPTVSKYLKAAQARGYLVPIKLRAFVLPEHMKVEHFATIAQRAAESAELLGLLKSLPLDPKTRGHIQSVHVIDTPDWACFDNTDREIGVFG